MQGENIINCQPIYSLLKGVIVNDNVRHFPLLFILKKKVWYPLHNLLSCRSYGYAANTAGYSLIHDREFEQQHSNWLWKLASTGWKLTIWIKLHKLTCSRHQRPVLLFLRANVIIRSLLNLPCCRLKESFCMYLFIDLCI